MSPRLDSDGWELESAEERRRDHPETFRIPPEAERARLPVGAMAQFLFLLAGELGGRG